jgi:anaerobic dimethyl sulfoxide reductase subunit A
MFLKLSGAAAGTVTAAEVFGPLGLDSILSEENAGETRVLSIVCNNNCGGRCRLVAYVRNGVITRIGAEETAETAEMPQLRPCLKGRSLRNRRDDPGRLLFPLKRTGIRGEGKFERVSWDAAIEFIAENLKAVVRDHGPASVYIQYGTGDCGSITGVASAQRLMNLLGGYLGYYNSYSSACLRYTAPYVMGSRDTNSYQTLLDSRLIILNGFNPAETVFETNSNLYLARAREAGARVVVIDPRLSETAATFADQWVPLRPTTDTALFVAMAHVMVTEGLHDQAFLDRYCVGFDEEHMPAGVPAGQSFKSYVLGLQDGIPKTPEWGAAITRVEATVIRNLARDYATIKPAQLIQGLGPQRHAHGEESVRAGIALACMTGNVGIQGGGWGGGEGSVNLGLGVGTLPTGKNPVKTRIPVFLWTDAVVRGTEMTAADGVTDGPLPSNIKFIFNIASNTLINQHADVNKTAAILRDESLVRCIVVSDHFMTPSARFADILLPADNSLEREDLGFPWSGEKYIVFGNKVAEPPGECRHDYRWLAKVAEKLGIGDAFTEGRTERDWLRHIIERARSSNPAFPAYEELRKTGIYRVTPEKYVAYEKEIGDPARHPFRTPSGKIEIFSRTLFEMNHPLIPGAPRYIPAWEGPEDPLRSRYPLQCIGPHIKRRTHSTFDENAWMEEADPQVLWISPQDAAARRISEGDRVRVHNDRGSLQIAVRITKRVRPGVVSIPQGAWYTPDRSGVCQRGCINLLTSQKPTPLAHGNAQHTILVEVERL